MTSNTATKTASPKTSSPTTKRKTSQQQSRQNSRKHSLKHSVTHSVKNSVKCSVKNPDRINRQRRLQKQVQILLLERHSRRCIICHHPEREAIEEEFVHWRAPWKLAQDYKLDDYRTVYRHARAAGLLLQRRERLHSALDAFVESVDDVTFTGDTILRAMRAYSCIDSHGRWTEIPTQVQFSTSNDAHPPQPPRTSNVGSGVFDIASDEESGEDEENALEERVTSLSTSSKSMPPSDNTACPTPSKPMSRSDTTACAASPAQALPRDVVRGQNSNDRSPSDQTDCAALPLSSSGSAAQPAAPQKTKPDVDGRIRHKRPCYPDQEMSEPDAQGRVMYKIHMTTAASQLPSRETDAQRAAKLIYRSVIEKHGNP